MSKDARNLAATSTTSHSEMEDDQEVLEILEEDPQPWSSKHSSGSGRRRRGTLLKQFSMRETRREAKWERRRSQIHQRRKMMTTTTEHEDDVVVDGEGNGSHMRVRSLTDEDLDELRGSIELGFGFVEDTTGHNLCDTLPALDLYFAVNRQLSDPKLHSSSSIASTPTSASTLCGTPSPRSPHHHHSSSADSWTIFNPGDNPQHMKTRLRHWAQAVACSVRQCRQCG